MLVRIIGLAFACDNRLYSVRNPLSCMLFIASFCCIGSEIVFPRHRRPVQVGEGRGPSKRQCQGSGGFACSCRLQVDPSLNSTKLSNNPSLVIVSLVPASQVKIR